MTVLIVGLISLGITVSITGEAFIKTERACPGSCDPMWYYFPTHSYQDAPAGWVCKEANYPRMWHGACCQEI